MIQLNKISIFLNKNDWKLIENFTYVLNKGDKTAIIGEEGDGKSTLLKLMSDERLIENYANYTGSVTRMGKIAYLPQFESAENNDAEVESYIGESEISGYSDFEFLYDRSLAKRKLGSLSGGERIKIRLYKLLVAAPDVLLLDEPSNDLDAQSLALLCDIIKQTSAAVAFISHDQTLIKSVANGIIHIEQLAGKQKSRITVSRLSYDDYVADRERLFDRNAKIAEKERVEYRKKTEKLRKLQEKAQHNQSWKNEDGIPSSDGRAKRNAQGAAAKARRFERERQEMTEIPQKELCILTKFDANIGLPRSKKIVEMDIPELTAGETMLVKNIEFKVFGNEHVCITGRNGAGKSTLLKKIYDELSCRRDITVGYMPQNYADVLDFSATPTEFLNRTFDKERRTKAMTYMGSMNFTRDEMNSPIGTLSGGTQAKLIFLRMVIEDANVLLLDEPTRNFSPLSAPVIRDALKNFGGAFVCISHDELFVSEIAHSVYFLSEEGLKRL